MLLLARALAPLPLEVERVRHLAVAVAPQIPWPPLRLERRPPHETVSTLIAFKHAPNAVRSMQTRPNPFSTRKSKKKFDALECRPFAADFAFSAFLFTTARRLLTNLVYHRRDYGFDIHSGRVEHAHIHGACSWRCLLKNRHRGKDEASSPTDDVHLASPTPNTA